MPFPRHFAFGTAHAIFTQAHGTLTFRPGSRKKDAMRQIKNSDRKANHPGSGCHGSNTRLHEWNKTERNTLGVSSPLLDHQALATIKTERPFRFPLTNARRHGKYTEPIRGNPNLHTRTLPICTTTAPKHPLQPLRGVTVSYAELRLVTVSYAQNFFSRRCNTPGAPSPDCPLQELFQP